MYTIAYGVHVCTRASLIHSLNPNPDLSNQISHKPVLILGHSTPGAKSAMYNCFDLQVAGGGKGKKVSYPYFMAFISLLNNMELLRQIHDLATRRSSVAELTKGYHLIILAAIFND